MQNTIQATIQVTVTTPGQRPLNIQRSIELNEPLNHELIELEVTAEGYIYTSKADFHPAQSRLLVHRRNPDKTISFVEFPDCHDLKDAVGVMAKMFSLLNEFIAEGQIDRAASLLMFNLDKTFLETLDAKLD